MYFNRAYIVLFFHFHPSARRPAVKDGAVAVFAQQSVPLELVVNKIPIVVFWKRDLVDQVGNLQRARIFKPVQGRGELRKVAWVRASRRERFQVQK